MLREDPHLVFISQREDQFFFYYCYMYFKTNGIVSAFTYFHKRPFSPVIIVSLGVVFLGN